MVDKVGGGGGKRAKSAKSHSSSQVVTVLSQTSDLEKYTCNICQEVVDSANPIRLRACEHLFCQGCITQAGKSSSAGAATKSPRGKAKQLV